MKWESLLTMVSNRHCLPNREKSPYVIVIVYGIPVYVWIEFSLTGVCNWNKIAQEVLKTYVISKFLVKIMQLRRSMIDQLCKIM